MIIFIDRAKPIRLRQSLFGRCRAINAMLKQILTRRQGGGAMVQCNLFRELALQNRFFWRAGYDSEPMAPSTDIAWVLSSKRDLQRGLALKRQGRVKQLWAGPNLTVVPQEAGDLFRAAELDVCIVPCAWVADSYAQEAPYLKEKLTIWPVGIDTSYWQTTQSPKKNLLVYTKNQPALAQHVMDVLNTRNIVTQGITYGAYTPAAFRQALSQAWGMIWLSRSESQGLAYLEALSANVPVLAWDPGTWAYRSQALQQDFTGPASSVPYFDASCGLTFKDQNDFAPAFDRFQSALSAYKPRSYIFSQKLDLASNLDLLAPLAQFDA